MKKIYLTIATVAFAMAAQAQGLIEKPLDRYKMNAEEVMNQRKHYMPASNRSFSFYMDHSTGNFDDGFFLWNMNSNYTAQDTALNFIGLSLSKIFGYTDAADPSGTVCDSSLFGFSSSYPMNIGLQVDSIFTQITHENNSGTYNKITMQVVKNTTGAAPATATGVTNVLWESVDSTNVSLSPSGNWLGTGAAVVLQFAPTAPMASISPGSSIGLVFKYEDPTKMDSLGMIAGFVKDPADANKALQSTIKTSFMRYPPNIPSVTKTSNVGYGSPVGSGGWYQAQNWGMWAYVTVGTDVSGFNENSLNGFRVLETYPNPTNNMTNVRYELGVASQVSLVVTDITGKVVYKTNATHQNAGQFTLNLGTDNLNNGVYNYTLTANNASISKRIVVQH